MSTKLKATLTITWIMLTRSYDAYSTYQLTPDLSKEANPLVSVVGVDSWSLLLIILGCITVYTLYAYITRIQHPMNLAPEEKNLSFSQFVAYIYLGRKDHWSAIFYKFPHQLKRLNQYMGEFMTKALVYAGFVSTLMWVLIHNSESYRSIHSPSLIYTVLIGGTLAIGYYWNAKMYKAYVRS